MFLAGSGHYFAELLEGNEFDDSEKVFIAVHGEDIVGFVALVNESCAEDTNFWPWLDFLFVDEKFRNKGIAGRLVEHVLLEAANENIDSVYLCTVSHEEMYAKFGFRTICETIINGGARCRVMKRQL